MLCLDFQFILVILIPLPLFSLLRVYHLRGQISHNMGRGFYSLDVPRCLHYFALSSLRD
jgi:hypothetical protein